MAIEKVQDNKAENVAVLFKIKIEKIHNANGLKAIKK